MFNCFSLEEPSIFLGGIVDNCGLGGIIFNNNHFEGALFYN